MLRAVATDGHRLARMEVGLPEGAEGIPGVIIPRKTINELYKLVEEGGEKVEISMNESKIRFAVGNAVLVSKLALRSPSRAKLRMSLRRWHQASRYQLPR